MSEKDEQQGGNTLFCPSSLEQNRVSLSMRRRPYGPTSDLHLNVISLEVACFADELRSNILISIFLRTIFLYSFICLFRSFRMCCYDYLPTSWILFSWICRDVRVHVPVCAYDKTADKLHAANNTRGFYCYYICDAIGSYSLVVTLCYDFVIIITIYYSHSCITYLFYVRVCYSKPDFEYQTQIHACIVMHAFI